MVSDGRVNLGLDNGHGVKGSLELRDNFLGGLEPGVVRRDVPGHDSEGDIGDGRDIVEHACSQLGRRITVVVVPKKEQHERPLRASLRTCGSRGLCYTVPRIRSCIGHRRAS